MPYLYGFRVSQTPKHYYIERGKKEKTRLFFFNRIKYQWKNKDENTR